MFATRLRVSPWSARSSPRSLGRDTTISSLACSSFMRRGTCCVSSPSGPFTITRPGSSETDTPAGISIGFLPMRLKSQFRGARLKSGTALLSPDKTDDFAADAFALGGLGGYQAPGGRHDRRAQAPEGPWEAMLLSVHAASRLGDPLQVGDDPLPARPVLELDDESVVALAPVDGEPRDVALLLED